MLVQRQVTGMQCRGDNIVIITHQSSADSAEIHDQRRSTMVEELL